MPIYSTRCPACGWQDAIWRRIDARNDMPLCACGNVTERILDRPMVMAEITPYTSPYDGRTIYSRSERRADLAQANAIEWEPGIEKDIARRQEYLKEESFKPIADTVDDIVRDLNVSGKLENLNA